MSEAPEPTVPFLRHLHDFFVGDDVVETDDAVTVHMDVRVPEGVDPETMEASLDKGVLKLRIPKPGQSSAPTAET